MTKRTLRKHGAKGLSVAAILPAAGEGKRLNSSLPKPLVRVGSAPLVVQTLKALTSAHPFTRVLLPVDSALMPRIQKLLKQHQLHRVEVIPGGRTALFHLLNNPLQH